MSIGRNTVVNVGGQVVPLIASLLVVPPYLRAIGESRYGVLLIVWMLLGYFGMFDFGLNRAVAQRVAELHETKDASCNRVIWTALLLAGGLSLLGAALLWWAGGHGLDKWFGAEASLRSEFLGALPWVVLVLPVSLLSQTLSGAMQGRERFLSLNIIQTVGTLWSQLVPMAVAWWWSVDLCWLVPAALSARVVTGVWMFIDCQRQVPMTLTPVFECTLVKSLFSYGGWVTISSIVSPILTTFDRFVIGAMSGAAAVTHYNVPAGIVGRVAVVPSALAGAIFPRFAVGEIRSRLRLLVQSTGALAAVMTPAALGMMFLIGPFLGFWIGPELAAKGTLVGELMVLGVWVNGLALLPHAYLQANGRPRISAIFHLAELLPYMLLLWMGLKFWGVAGAALAGTLRLFADTILHFQATGEGGACWSELLTPGSLLLASFATVFWLGPASPWRWAIAVGLLAASLIWGWKRLPERWQRLCWPFMARKPHPVSP